MFYFSFLLQSEFADTNDEGIQKATNIQEAVSDEIKNSPLIELCTTENIMDLCSIDENVTIDTVTHAYNENSSCEQGNLLSKVLGNNSISSKISMAITTLKKPTDSITAANPHNGSAIPAKATKPNSWMELFSELDPLANLEAFDLKLSGGSKSSQQT